MRVWNPRKTPGILAALLLAGPMLGNIVLIMLAEQPRWTLAAALGGIALLVLAALYRVRLWRTIRNRVLHARPTDHCRTCGYSAAGLEVQRVDSGTLPFEQAQCPECGRRNPR